jgi:hypothetical protein
MKGPYSRHTNFLHRSLDDSFRMSFAQINQDATNILRHSVEPRKIKLLPELRIQKLIKEEKSIKAIHSYR